MSIKVGRIGEQFKNIFIVWIQAIRDTDAKYKKPRIKMTLGVKIALISLRVYLVLLISLSFFKLFTLIYQGK
jgi:hypothetical protein